jgi:hypothetical protein
VAVLTKCSSYSRVVGVTTGMTILAIYELARISPGPDIKSPHCPEHGDRTIDHGPDDLPQRGRPELQPITRAILAGDQTEINTAILIQQIAEGLRFLPREPVVRTPTMLGFQPFGATLAGAVASTISVRAALLAGGLGT